MILLFEQDVRRASDGCRFRWCPGGFVGWWAGRRTWRLWWGFWSLSYVPAPGLLDFYDYVEQTEWVGTVHMPGCRTVCRARGERLWG